MASQWGRQSMRWSGSGRTARTGALPSPPSDRSDPDGQSVPATASETADIYRSLLDQLRGAFGGTIDEANADAIAFAASELYHRDVDPKLWEQKTAQETLDRLGVPTAGTFTRYSLADRLLLLRRSASPDRTDRAHALLTELGAPERRAGGGQLALKDRLDWLLESVGPPTRSVRPPGDDQEDPRRGGPAEASGDSDSGGPASQQVVDAPETICRAAAADDPAPSPSEPLGPATGDLVTLETAIGTIRDELVELRRALHTVQSSLDEVLALLRTGTGDNPTPQVAQVQAVDLESGTSGGPSLADASAADRHADGVEAPLELPPSADEADEPLPEAIAAPDDVTQPVPVVDSGPAIEEITKGERHRRRLGLPMLILIAVVVGLVIAGVAILISVVGWNELRSNMHALTDVFSTASVPLPSVRPPARVG